LSVVAANSFAAGSTVFDSSIAIVAVHASSYTIHVSPAFPGFAILPYRFLELLQEVVCLLFRCSIRPRLHRVVGCQDRSENLLLSVGGHVGVSVMGQRRKRTSLGGGEYRSADYGAFMYYREASMGVRRGVVVLITVVKAAAGHFVCDVERRC
jgi:hypothetical protein